MPKSMVLPGRTRVLLRYLFALGLLATGIFSVVGAASAQTADIADTILVSRLDAPIDSVSGRILDGWLEEAERRDVQLFVLELDTPGGSIEATRTMVGSLLEAPVPVVVFVTPAGSRAASAGTFIVAAANIAAMAPSTNIGAASPVGFGGEELPETIKSKATQDAAALLRSIASERGRNAEALDRTIFDATSYSVEEALEAGIIDVTATDLTDLLDKIDGTSVTVNGTERTLATTGATVERVDPTRIQSALRWLANPQLVFIMLGLGGILVLIELVNPGGWVAGVTGAGLLILAFLGIGNLPVNWAGLVLMGAGIVLIFIELQAPGWGGFGLAGGIAFVLGGFFLFGDSSVPGLPAPDVRVGFGVLGGTAGFMALAVAGLWYFARKAKAIQVVPRNSQIVGQSGVVRRTLDPKGTVQVDSELWTAESESGDTIESGETIVVSEVDGVTLKVFREASLEAFERSLS